MLRKTLLLFTTLAISTSAAASEREGLRKLFEATGGALWLRGASGPQQWLSNESACTWYGITCNAGGNVIEINLGFNNLSGSLPADLALDLPSLQVFYVDANHIGGTVPDISGLHNLSVFSVGYNLMTGMLPSLSGLTRLQSFSVAANQFSGPMPDLTALAALLYFDISNNQIDGTIPPLTGLSVLATFDVAGNRLEGAIPALLQSPHLQQAVFSSNALSGSIPPLADLTELSVFAASSNRLSGPIPALATLTHLSYFNIGNNDLTGPVPEPPPNLRTGGARLCPNLLDLTPSPSDAAWNDATGHSPWWNAPDGSCDVLFQGRFEPVE